MQKRYRILHIPTGYYVFSITPRHAGSIIYIVDHDKILDRDMCKCVLNHLNNDLCIVIREYTRHKKIFNGVEYISSKTEFDIQVIDDASTDRLSY